LQPGGVDAFDGGQRGGAIVPAIERRELGVLE
jgi:hypothetical protein